MEIPHGIFTALSTKLDKACRLVLSGVGHADSVHYLETFMHFVENHDGKKIATEDAGRLIDAAQDTVSLLQLDLGNATSMAVITERAGGLLLMLGLAANNRQRRC